MGASKPPPGAEPDNPIGGDKEYQELFRKLKRIFEWNSCPYPEDLAQEAIQRGLHRIKDGTAIWAENPASFFAGIARMIVLEQRKARRMEPLEDADARPAPEMPGFAGLSRTEMNLLLEQRLRELSPEERELLTDYVSGIKPKTNLTPQALRVRIHRILKKLKRADNL